MTLVAKMREMREAKARDLGMTLDELRDHERSARAARAPTQASQGPGSAPTSSGANGPILGARISTFVPEIVAKSKLPRVSTGLRELDARLGGGLELHSTTLIVAGTGKGKTSLALQMAADHAATAPVIYYAGEMACYRVAARVIGQRTGRAWSDVLRAGIGDEQMNAALEALHLYIVPRQANPLDAIAKTIDHVRDVERVAGIPMIVVDYVQIMADVAKDQRLAVMDAARDFRAFMDHAPAVAIVLSQSSRGGSKMIREGTEHAEELVGTGAETAELEQGATNVLVLSYTMQDGAEDHDVTCMVAKARDRGPSRIGLRYHGRTGRWAETDRIVLPEPERLRREEILRQIDLHTAGSCIFGRGACGHDLTVNELSATKGAPHKVTGSRGAVQKSVKAMIADKTIVRVGNDLRRAVIVGAP